MARGAGVNAYTGAFIDSVQFKHRRVDAGERGQPRAIHGHQRAVAEHVVGSG